MPVLISDQAYASIRTLVRGVLGHVTTGADDCSLAENVQFHLKTAETIDGAEVKDVIEYAQKAARESNGSTAAGIVEKAERLRASLATVSMNPKAVTRIGDVDDLTHTVCADRNHRLSDQGTTMTTPAPSIVFQQRGDVIEASPTGASIRIELLDPDHAHVRLLLDELPAVSLTVNASPVYTIVDEACSLASALYWSRRRALEHGAKTWSIAVAEADG